MAFFGDFLLNFSYVKGLKKIFLSLEFKKKGQFVCP
jgi:hypothetical protein